MPAPRTPTSDTLATIARLLLALLFLAGGLAQALDFQATAEMMVGLDLPVPSVLLTTAILVQLVGGTCLLTGRGAHLAALALIGLLIPATLVLHGAGLADPTTAQAHLADVLKNVAVIGGLIQVHLSADPAARSARPETTRPAQRTTDRKPARREYDVIDSPFISIR